MLKNIFLFQGMIEMEDRVKIKQHYPQTIVHLTIHRPEEKHIFTTQYFESLGFECHISNSNFNSNSQSGGGQSNTENISTVPYRYFEYFFSSTHSGVAQKGGPAANIQESVLKPSPEAVVQSPSGQEEVLKIELRQRKREKQEKTYRFDELQNENSQETRNGEREMKSFSLMTWEDGITYETYESLYLDLSIQHEYRRLHGWNQPFRIGKKDVYYIQGRWVWLSISEEIKEEEEIKFPCVGRIYSCASNPTTTTQTTQTNMHRDSLELIQN